MTELRPDAIIARGVWGFHGQSYRWVGQLQLCELGDFAAFLRMFDHYRFRGRVAAATAGEKPPLGLVEDDSWSRAAYAAGSEAALSRRLFAGTLS